MGRAEDLFRRIEEHGEAAIDELIQSRASEELFLDFKQSSNHGKGTKLADDDRKNYAKALSGFGNSEGGVIVWGVECKADASGADVPNAKKPLADPEKFVSWLEASTSGRTLPPHPTVRSIAVRGSTGTGGYVATLVPKSNRAPHQVIGEDKYYIRSGSSFSAAPHGVLAGLFGRRPQPTVWVTYHAEPPTAKAAKLFAELGIVLHNDGPGIAEDMYCTLSFGTHPGEITVGPSDVRLWRTWSYLGCRWATIATREFLLPPDAEAQPFTLKLVMDAQGIRPMHIRGVVGARDATPFHFEFNSTIEDVRQVYDELCGALPRVTPRHEHVYRLFGINVEARTK